MERQTLQLLCATVFVFVLHLGSASPRGLFMDDKDIENFLRLYNTDVMLWSCKNGIDFKYINPDLKKLSTSIALKCDVLGVPSSVSIEHNFFPVKGDGSEKMLRTLKTYKKARVENSSGNQGRYQLLVGPHFEGSKMFYDWKEYTFKINDPTAADSGLYRIFVRGPSGKTQQQLVYVNLKRYEPLLKKVRAENRRLNELKEAGASGSSSYNQGKSPTNNGKKGKSVKATQAPKQSKYHRKSNEGRWQNY